MQSTCHVTLSSYDDLNVRLFYQVSIFNYVMDTLHILFVFKMINCTACSASTSIRHSNKQTWSKILSLEASELKKELLTDDTVFIITSKFLVDFVS